MAYYQSNAVYDRLIDRGGMDFTWTAGNSWVLLYGDMQSRAKLVVFLLGETATRVQGNELARLKRARALAAQMARDARLKFATIVFDDTSAMIESVKLNGTAIALDALTTWFEEAALSVRHGATAKSINDASSSAYHTWQRDSLGAIRVSDIDLIFAPEGRASSICKLKRSYLPLIVGRHTGRISRTSISSRTLPTG